MSGIGIWKCGGFDNLGEQPSEYPPPLTNLDFQIMSTLENFTQILQTCVQRPVSLDRR